MFKQTRFFLGFTAFAIATSLSLLSQTIAQTPRPSALGRGVANGSVFNRGRNANVSLTVNRNNFGFELTEPSSNNRSNRNKVEYRGTVVRQTNSDRDSGSFTLDGRVQSFTSSANLRPINNTTGTCQIEVFDSRVISSTCRTVTSDSTTRFFGLEQF
jgi:hypothetical protein